MIEIKDLTKLYGKGEIAVKALRNISFKVNKGEFVAIMGPSGSGKSTLMNILGCLDTPTSGEYYLEGITVSQMKEKELAYVRNQKIGFVFQTFNLLPQYSAFKNVEMPMVYKGVSVRKRRQIAREALRSVGLENRIHHKPNELSGGQKQRVAIARALVNQPRIILADEPTGNLDSKSEEEILTIIDGLHKQGITIIMVTHDKNVALHAQRIVHFMDGEIIAEEVVELQQVTAGGGEVGETI